MQNDTPLDMLQIKIERARDNLPLETRKAIDSVDWRAFVLSLREKKGFSFEQLEDLELETELLLAGLLNPENYPKELEKRMGIPKSQVDLLVNEMNETVFKKIREELIKNTERKELFIKKTGEEKEQIIQPPVVQNIYSPKTPTPPVNQIINQNKPNFLDEIGLKRVGDKEKSDLFKGKLKNLELPKTTNVFKDMQKDTAAKNPTESISSQKLAGSFQIPTIRTEYSLDSAQKSSSAQVAPIPQKDSTALKITKEDPYRIAPGK